MQTLVKNLDVILKIFCISVSIYRAIYISKHFKIRWFIVSYSPVCYVCFYLILAEKCIKFALYHLLLRPSIRKYKCVRAAL